VVVVPVMALVGLLGMLGRPSTTAAPPTTVPFAAFTTTTTPRTAGTTTTTTTTVPATNGSPPTTSDVVTNVVGPPRVGTRNGVLTKPDHPGWSVQRMLATTGVAVGGLVVLGWVYGRIRSIPPRRPEMSVLPDVIEET